MKLKSGVVIKRAKAFYPYRRTEQDIAINITLKNFASIHSLEPENIDIELLCPGFQNQVETWDRLFGIKEIYKAECCSEEMLAIIEEQYIAEMNYGQSRKQYIGMLSKNKYANCNFLKIPFLKALA